MRGCLVYFKEVCIGRGGIKIFVRPNENGHVGFADILNAVRAARRNVNDLVTFAADFVLKNFVGKNLPETNDALARNDQKFFVLGVVPMIAFRDVRLDDVRGELPLPVRANEFLKTSALVLVNFQFVRKIFFGQITLIC